MEIVIPLRDTDEWERFVEWNREAVLEIYPTIAAALKAACEGGIAFGGGAQPIVRVFFVD